MGEEVTNRLHACVKAEIIKPIGATWEEVGPHLHALRNVSHRMLNTAITACAIADAERGESKKKLVFESVAYEATKTALERDRDFAQAMLAIGKTKDPIARERLERRAMLSVPSNIYNAASMKASQRYKTDRVEVFTGKKSLPSFRSGAPIFVRDGDRAWSIVKDGNGYTLVVKIYGGRSGSVRFALAFDGGSAFAHAKRLTDEEAIERGDIKRGDLKLVWLERKRKWLAIMSYGFPKPLCTLEPNRALAVHLGIRSFLTTATGDGDAGPLFDGGDIVAFKGQMDRRKRSLQRHRRELGTGARGHGVERRAATYRKLEDKEQRFVRTKCQQAASAVVKRAAAKGCGMVLIEDYSPKEMADGASEPGARFLRRWPFAELRACIKWACEREGIAVKIVPAAYESVTCPKCGNVDAEQDDRRGTFQCRRAGCELRRPADVVAAWNMLRRGGEDPGIEKSTEKTKEFVEKLKKVKTTKRKAAS